MTKRIIMGAVAAVALANVAPSVPVFNYNQVIAVYGADDPSVVMHVEDMSNPVVTFAGIGVDYNASYTLPGLNKWDGLLLYDANSGAILEGLFYMDYLYY